MQRGRSSQTAIAAAFRAIHAYGLPGEAIHEDPHAIPLIGVEEISELVDLMRAVGLPAFESTCAYFALRHRFAEDLLIDAITQGTRQVVVLGAGLDTFALRHPALVGELSLFEVDHPDTQAWKHERLAATGLTSPGVVYVAVDFERERVADRLDDAGLRHDEPTFYTWLGVSQYVDRRAASETFSLVGAGPTGSQLVLDIVLSSTEVDPDAQRVSDAYAAASDERGEPWISTNALAELTSDLRAGGLTGVRPLAPEDAARRYYGGQPAGVVPPSAWRLVHTLVWFLSGRRQPGAPPVPRSRPICD